MSSVTTGGGGTIGGGRNLGDDVGIGKTSIFRKVSNAFNISRRSISPGTLHKEEQEVSDKINNAIENFHEEVTAEALAQHPLAEHSVSKVKTSKSGLDDNLKQLQNIEQQITALKAKAHRLHSAEAMSPGAEAGSFDKENVLPNSKGVVDWKSIAKEVHQLRTTWKAKNEEIKHFQGKHLDPSQTKILEQMTRVNDFVGQFFKQHQEKDVKMFAKPSSPRDRSDSSSSSSSYHTAMGDDDVVSNASTSPVTSTSSDRSSLSSTSSRRPSVAPPINPSRRARPSAPPPRRPDSPTVSVSRSSTAESTASSVSSSKTDAGTEKAGRATFKTLWDEMGNPESRQTFLRTYRSTNSIATLLKDCLGISAKNAEGKKIPPSVNLGRFLNHQYNSAETPGDKQKVLDLAIDWASNPQFNEGDLGKSEVKREFDKLIATAKNDQPALAQTLATKISEAPKSIPPIIPVHTEGRENASPTDFTNKMAKVGKMNRKERNKFAKEFADSLKTESAQLYKQLKISETTDGKWEPRKDDPDYDMRKAQAPVITEMTDRTANLARFTARSILEQKTEKERVQMLKFFIEVEKQVRDEKTATKELPADSNAAKGLFLGIGHPQVARLNLDEKLSKETDSKDFKDLNTLHDNSRGNKNLKDHEALTLNTVPFIGFPLGSLVGQIEKDDISPEKDFVWSKLQTCNDHIKKLVSTQDNLNPNPANAKLNISAVFVPQDDKTLTDLSNAIKPPRFVG